MGWASAMALLQISENGIMHNTVRAATGTMGSIPDGASRSLPVPIRPHKVIFPPL